MMRHNLVLQSVLVILALPPLAAAAQSPGAAAETFTVEGRVVNSATEGAIRGALVQGFVGKQIAVLTGADGKFRLENVPAGQITLMANKPGYFSERDRSNGVSLQSFAIGPEKTSVVLRLEPEGVIFGRVTNEDGEPAVVPVKVLSYHIVNGRKQKEKVFTGFTNDEGEFRVANLRPGAYYVAAGPSQSSVRKKDSAGKMREAGASGEFYPGVADFAAATPIRVSAGAAIRADLSLTGQPFFEISGVISGYPAGTWASLQLMDTAGEQLEQGSEFSAATGAFQMHAPAGTYELRATSQDAKGRALSASQKLSVQADTNGVRLTLVPAIDVAVHTRLDAAELQEVPQPLTSVTLAPAEGLPGISPATANSEDAHDRGALIIRNVLPGSYAVDLNPLGPWYAQFARCGSTDLLRENLVVAPGGAHCTIEIGMRGDGATLATSIAGDAIPSAVFVLLAPENGAIRVLNVYPQPNQAFETAGLAPGRYKVVAVDRVDELEYTDRVAMEPLLAKGQEISLDAGKKTAVTLELIRRKP